jgi:hypothetical protein
VKLRLPSWLSDCGAALALLALALLLVAPTSSVTPTDARTYLSAAGAADDHWTTQLAKQRQLIRAEVVRWLRGGRGPADRLSASQPAPLLSAAQRMPPPGSPAAPKVVSGEAAALAAAHHRPAPTGPPALG